MGNAASASLPSFQAFEEAAVSSKSDSSIEEPPLIAALTDVARVGVGSTVTCLCYNHTDALLGVALQSGTLKLFGAPGVEISLRDPGHAPATWLYFLPHGPWLLALGESLLDIYDWSSGKQLRCVILPFQVQCCSLYQVTPTRLVLLLGTRVPDSRVLAFDLQSLSLTGFEIPFQGESNSVGSPTASVTSLAVSQDVLALTYGSPEPPRVLFWHLPSQKVIGELPCHGLVSPHSLSWNSKATHLAVVDDQSQVQIWALPNALSSSSTLPQQPRAQWQLPNQPVVKRVVWLQHPLFSLIIATDSQILCYDARSFQLFTSETISYPLPSGANLLAFDLAGSSPEKWPTGIVALEPRLVKVLGGQTLQYWSEDLRLWQMFSLHMGPDSSDPVFSEWPLNGGVCSNTEHSKDEEAIALVSSTRNELNLYDWSSPFSVRLRWSWTTKADVTACHVEAPRGDVVVIGCQDGTLLLLECVNNAITSEKMRLEGVHTGPVLVVAYQKDRHLIAAADLDGGLTLTEVHSERARLLLQHQLSSRGAHITSVTFMEYRAVETNSTKDEKSQPLQLSSTRVLLAGTSQGHVLQFNLEDGSPITTNPFPRAPSNGSVFLLEPLLVAPHCTS